MAGDWIKYDVTLPDKPEVWTIAEAVGIEADAVIGKLMRIWAWFDLHTEDGVCQSVTAAQLDSLVGSCGFCNAMASVGWLVIHKHKRTIAIPGFDLHNGESAKKRALTKERVKRFRNAVSVTGALPEKRREEKRKEEEKKTPRPALPAADRRDAGVRLGAAPAAPSAGEPAEKPPPPPARSPDQRRTGLSHLSNLLRQVHPPDPEVDAVRAELEAKEPIPLPTAEAASA